MARQRKYPSEPLDRGARVVIESGRPIAHVARDLGVPAETLRRHVRRVEADEGLGVSASAYYQRANGQRSKRAIEDERLLGRIGELHAANYYAYGYRRMWKALLRAGEHVPRCQVQRLIPLRRPGLVLIAASRVPGARVGRHPRLERAVAGGCQSGWRAISETKQASSRATATATVARFLPRVASSCVQRRCRRSCARQAASIAAGG